MAIEPIGSMMSIQAQSYQVPKNVQENVQAENKDVAVGAEQQVVDTQTLAVKKTEQTDTEHGSDSFGQTAGQQSPLIQQAQKTSENASSEQLKKAVEKINRSINHSNEEAIFGIHEGTNRVTIKIVDKESKKVIKELPPEKTLDMIAKVWEIAGIMVDEKR